MFAFNLDWHALGQMLFAFPPPTLLKGFDLKILLHPVSVVRNGSDGPRYALVMNENQAW